MDDPKVKNITDASRDSRGLRNRVKELEQTVDRHDMEILILIAACLFSIGALTALAAINERQK